MLASINPLGERARGNRWGHTVAAYTWAATASAAVLGAAVGGIGGLAGFGGRWAVVALGAAAVGAGLADLWAPGRLPTTARQVDERWLARYRGWIYGAGFGAQLGVGVATVITSATVYAWLVAAAVSGSAAAGAVVGASFGIGRSLPFLAVVGIRAAPELRARLRRLAAWSRRGRLIGAGTALAVGAVCLAARP
jgi:cytochrome c biogenesis protein CcdA